jgi:hypothetical protein
MENALNIWECLSIYSIRSVPGMISAVQRDEDKCPYVRSRP